MSRDEFNIALLRAWTRSSQQNKKIVERAVPLFDKDPGAEYVTVLPGLFFVDEDGDEHPSEEVICRMAFHRGWEEHPRSVLEVPASKGSILPRFADFLKSPDSK